MVMLLHTDQLRFHCIFVLGLGFSLSFEEQKGKS